MTRTPTTQTSFRIALAALLALSLVVGAFSTALPGVRSTAVALDDDESKGKGKGGNVDEDDNRGKGNDDDRVDEDNPGNGNGKGNGKKDKEKKGKDDETELVTAVPTATDIPPTAVPASTGVPPTATTSAQPTQIALTPIASLSPSASTPVTTGTLAVSLRICPAGMDGTGGTEALAEACVDGKAGAVFGLAGRSGLYGGWRRDLTTKADGTAQATRLAEGTYALTLDDLDWCAAEASNVADGLIVVEPGETTEVTAYLCGDPTVR